MVDESVVRVVREYLQAVARNGIPVDFGIVFGSQVTGRADEWSDIDLLVVSPRFDGQRTRADANLLWHVATDVDSRIEPVGVGQRQFEEDDGSPIIEIARREGQKVLPDN